MTKNIIVVDENGKEYTSTYAKRAKGLVKNGRARWLDGNTICLVCPPDTLSLEDNDMLNNAENMGTINEVCENEELKNEAANSENVKEKLQAITIADILNRLDMIITQGDNMQSIVLQIQQLPVNESPYGGEDSAHRAEAIGKMYTAREATNQKMIDLLNRMYDDISPKQVSDDAKIKVVEKIAKMDFAGVAPATAEMILKFVHSSLM